MTDIFDTKEKVHNRGKEAIGKTLSELLKSNGLSENGAPKSVAGDAWEAWFKVKKIRVQKLASPT